MLFDGLVTDSDWFMKFFLKKSATYNQQENYPFIRYKDISIQSKLYKIYILLVSLDL
jgi:hypothetical protein